MLAASTDAAEQAFQLSAVSNHHKVDWWRAPHVVCLEPVVASFLHSPPSRMQQSMEGRPACVDPRDCVFETCVVLFALPGLEQTAKEKQVRYSCSKGNTEQFVIPGASIVFKRTLELVCKVTVGLSRV